MQKKVPLPKREAKLINETHFPKIRSNNIFQALQVRMGQNGTSSTANWNRLPDAIYQRKKETFKEVKCRNRFVKGDGDWQPYSIDIPLDGKTILCGGKRGQVKLFLRDEKQETFSMVNEIVSPYDVDYKPPLATFRAHDRWISGVRWIQSKSKDQMFMTTSDDCSLAIWSMEELALSHHNEDPEWDSKFGPIQRITEEDNFHSKGIFSMDSFENKVLTGSKDQTIALSTISNACLIPSVRRFRDFHSGTVKSVAFRDENVFASGGHDQILNIFDCRATDPLIASSTNSHEFAINNVIWRPYNNTMLLSSAFDNKLCMHDMRKLENGPLFIMSEHQTGRPSSKIIYRPLFMSDGNFVTATGPTETVVIYSASMGHVINRVPIEFSPSHTSTCQVSGGESLVAFWKKWLFVLDIM